MDDVPYAKRKYPNAWITTIRLENFLDGYAIIAILAWDTSRIIC
jgi:hypothetical protein